MLKSGEYPALIWDILSGEPLHSRLPIEALYLSLGIGNIMGDIILATSSSSGRVKLWFLNKGNKIVSYSLNNPEFVHKVSFGDLNSHPIIALSGFDGKVRLWDPLQNKEIGEPIHHPELLDYMTLNSFGGSNLLATACDKEIRIWNLDRFTLNCSPITLESNIHSMMYAQIFDRQVLISADKNTIQFFDPYFGHQLYQIRLKTSGFTVINLVNKELLLGIAGPGVAALELSTNRFFDIINCFNYSL